MIFEMVPTSLKYAFAAGIGFFIAMIGFKNSGLLAEGTVFNHMETLVTPNSLLFILGMVLTTVFTIMRLKGGLLLGILIVTVVGVPLGVTVMPDDFTKDAFLSGTAILSVLFRLPFVARLLGLCGDHVVF